MKKTLLKCASLAFALLLCSYGYAQKTTAPQKKTFTREYIYDANEADSKLTARAFAERRLKEGLLREVGEFLQSEKTLSRRSVMKNGKEELTEDFSEKIMAITAGIIEMEILQETWNGKTYYVLAKMTVDTEEVSRRINEVLNDKRKTQELEELRKQKLAAEAEAARLRRELAQEKNKNNAAMKQAYQQQAEVLGKDEWEEVKKRSFEVGLEKGEDGVYRPRQYENAPDSKTKYEEEEEQRDREQKMLEQRKEIARKNELARQNREWEKLRQERAKMVQASSKSVKGWYQPHLFRIGTTILGSAEGVCGEISYSYTRNISPNFGFDIFQLSAGGGGDKNLKDSKVGYGQLLTGLRFATNSFGETKNTYFYTSVRAGYGFFGYATTYYYNYIYLGFAFAAELEAGFHFNEQDSSLGLVVVNHGFFTPNRYDARTYTKLGNGGTPDRIPFIGLRLGLDFGKRKPY